MIDTVIAFVCTDRGTHPRRVLGHARLREVGMDGTRTTFAFHDTPSDSKTASSKLSAEQVLERGSLRGEVFWFDPCPSCRRRPRATRAALLTIAVKLVEAGRTDLDISHLT